MLVQLGLLVSLRGYEVHDLSPDLVFEEDFGALHLEASMQEV